MITSGAEQFARRLKSFLDKFHFDDFSQIVRGCYRSSPFPFVAISMVASAIDHLMDPATEAPDNSIMRLFLLGENVNKHHVLQALDDDGLYREGLYLGIFQETEDGAKVSLNGLILVSKEYARDKVMYCFADSPGSTFVSAKERAYVGAESYQLREFLQEMYKNVEGVVCEAGTGSGIQLISILLRNPGVHQALGLEVSQRARNLSIFNAHLNGVGSRYKVYADPAELVKNVPDKKIVLALTNPPFIPCPSIIRDSEDPGNAIDITQSWPLATFGGRDGLSITRRFLDILLPILAPEGKLVVWSQFAMNQSTALLIEELRVTRPNIGVDLYRYLGEHQTSPEMWAYELGKLWGYENPDQRRLGQAVESACKATLETLGVLAVEPACLVLSNNPETEVFGPLVFPGTEFRRDPYQAFFPRVPPVMPR